MADDNAPKEARPALRCASCRYDLQGLTGQARCPECGFSIARSQALIEEQRHPGDHLPRIRLAMALLLTSTLTGIPGIMLYALFMPASGASELSAIPSSVLWSFQGLLLMGSWAPVLTLAVLPRRALVDGGVGIMVGWGLGCLAGIGLINTPFQGLFLVGSALAVVCVIINLTRANRSIGSVVPAWDRLGQAKQTRGPLIASVPLIALGRLALDQIQGDPLDSLFGFWVLVITTGTEALLLVGCIYMAFNRLWLIFRLWRAVVLRTHLDP